MNIRVFNSFKPITEVGNISLTFNETSIKPNPLPNREKQGKLFPRTSVIKIGKGHTLSIEVVVVNTITEVYEKYDKGHFAWFESELKFKSDSSNGEKIEIKKDNNVWTITSNVDASGSGNVTIGDDQQPKPFYKRLTRDSKLK